jgi:multicomponent Na+:H+ antiporter subunit G
MTVVAEIFMVIGSAIAVLAGVGVLRFSTAYARFHAAGKASPVAFIVTSIGAGLTLGWQGAAPLALAVAAMTLTLPVGVHRTTPGDHLLVDELAPVEARVNTNRKPTSGA